MSLGKLASLLAFTALALAFQSCAGSSSESQNSITSAEQDLTLDPSGATTVVTFASADGFGSMSEVNFASDGGQTATGVTLAGSEATVTWSARVSPSDMVRVVGLDPISSAFHAVSTSDSTPPTFTIANGTQTSGLGGDTFDVQFAGVHVVESDVETLANWTLKIGTTTLALTGSTIVFDETTQSAAFTLGTLANLHASFTLNASGVHAVSDVLASTAPVAGTASGDSTAPTLVGTTQNLIVDEFGRIVDFQFSEAMDPVFSVQLSHFGVTTPAIAVDVSRPSDDVLRVTFNQPMVPGVDTVDLSSLVDAHGNAFVDSTEAIAQPSPVVNAFDGLPVATTVANAGGDTITVVTTQALDPRTAVDPTAWTLDVASVPVDLTTQFLDYDLLTKTLTISLDFDMHNADAFTVTGVNTLDVDGQTFALSSGGSASGDATAPTLLNVTQNRTLDATGKTLVALFSEDVDEATAEALTSYSVSGTQTLMTATQVSPTSVQLEFDALVVPGDVTFGVQDVTDLAGNAITTALGIPIATTDVTVPHPLTFNARAIEGADNDTVTVGFDDDMIESEVETAANWHVESPVGNVVSTVGATAVYTSASKTAVLTFANGVDFQRGDDAAVHFTGCRDIAGNTAATTVLSGAVNSESTLPTVHTIYRDASFADTVVIVFSEPCSRIDDLFDAVVNPSGTRYVLRDSGGIQRGIATAAASQSSGLAASVTFGIVVAPTDTIDVLGLADLCGNPMFPALAVPTLASDTSVPALMTGSSTLAPVSGENNDVISVVFDRPMSPWTLLDPSHYTITGTGPVSLASAVWSFDGTSTVTIALRSGTNDDLQTGTGYDVSVNGVWSAQGVQRSVADVESAITATGDVTAPDVPVGRVRIDPTTANALLVEADEALDLSSAQNAANYDYDSGNIATSAVRLGVRTVRVVFAVAPVVGQDLQFTLTDLAGNVSGTITRAVTAADAVGPLVSSVAGVIRPGWGGDVVSITFSEPVTSVTALSALNYGVTSGSRTLSMTNARLVYSSVTNTVTVLFASGQELDGTAPVSVSVGNVRDHSDNVMPAPIVVGGSVSGDITAPSISSAFVDWHDDANGLVVDVLFSEDVDTSWTANSANWTASGGQTVSSVTMPERNHARVVLGSALTASQTLSITTVPDLANNVSGPLTADPIE